MNCMKVFYICIFILSFFRWNVLLSNGNIDYQNLYFEHISVEDGLPSPFIMDVLQDEQGFMWFGTRNGLCRYDAYDFKVFQHNPEDTTSLSNNEVRCIIEDKNKQLLWVGTKYGLNILNKYNGQFERIFYDSAKSNTLWKNAINDLYQDKKGRVWIATSFGLNLYHPKQDSMIRIHIKPELYDGDTASLTRDISCLTFMEGERNYLWIGSWGHGLIKINKDNLEINQYLLGDNFKQNIVNKIARDSAGNLHLGASFGNGHLPHIIFDPENERIIDTANQAEGAFYSAMFDHAGKLWIGTNSKLLIYTDNSYNDPLQYPDFENKNDQNQGTFRKIFRDNAGNIWIANDKGLNVYFPYKNNFNTYYHAVAKSKHRDYGKTFYVDSQNRLWYGTFGDGILLFDENLRVMKRFLNENNNNESLAGNYIWSITEDQNGHVWIGTNNGISVYDPSKNKFARIIRKNESNNLSHNNVNDILHDKRGYVWISTQEGLHVFDPQKNTFRYVSESEGLCSYKVKTLEQDMQNNIWIGTEFGLSQYNLKRKKFINYFFNPKTGEGLSNQTINAIHALKSSGIWVGTENGLNRIDLENDTISYVLEDNGLAHNKISNIFEDIYGNLWINTFAGISNIHPFSDKIVNFGRKDGLNTNNSGMYLKDSILFVAEENSGFYTFNIHDIKTNPVIPPVYITKILVNGEPMEEILNLNQTHLKCKHQSSLTFEFTALNYLSPGKNQFKYKMKGVDEEWKYTSAKRRFAVYDNISPGNYSFHVKASNNGGIWNEKGTVLYLKITPPWWKTWWAVILYIIISIVLVYVLYNILKLKRELAQDEMKLNFFTNVSHEYRTPLTLIIEPLEKLISNSNLPETINNQLKLISGSAKRMKHLTNQILDLRKLESGNVKPNYQYGDVILFVKNLSASFEFMAQKQAINFIVNTPHESFYCYFDSSKLETILFNLLSNAFKYTFKNGEVSIDMNINPASDKNKNKNENDQLDIKVSNTGTPVSENEIKKIFDRYYQTEQYTRKSFKGTGIGLALVKELVTVLYGSIAVKNEPGNKISFIVRLPLFNKENIAHTEHVKGANQKQQKIVQQPISTSVIQESEKKKKNKAWQPLMLVAEDNPEMRTFIVSLFINDFRIIEAVDGKEGYKKALEHLPDIIISDLVMEGEDGLDFCNNIKTNEKTNHIPFLILTAKTANQSKMQGYQTGADDYINKPFDSNVLAAKVNNLLNNRARLKEYYHKRFLQDDMVEEKIVIKHEAVNELFIKKVKDIINENMHCEDFTVTELLSHFKMSHTHMNRKLKSIIGLTAREFIKLSKLNKAMHLLKTVPGITVSEVAYKVGFKEVTNFSRAYKKHFGISPSKIEGTSNKS